MSRFQSLEIHWSKFFERRILPPLNCELFCQAIPILSDVISNFTSGYPTDLFTNPSFDVPELHEMCRAPDFEALKLWKGRSGIRSRDWQPLHLHHQLRVVIGTWLHISCSSVYSDFIHFISTANRNPLWSRLLDGTVIMIFFIFISVSLSNHLPIVVTRLHCRKTSENGSG